jgi:hypothetical protein
MLKHSKSLAAILPKTIASCLPDGKSLKYNWDEKLRGLVLGICLSRSLILQSIAQTRPGNVKTTENNLSAFLGNERLVLSPVQKTCVINTLKRKGRRKFFKYRGKLVLIIDSTSYAKARSRRKIRPLPGKGQVRVHNLRVKEKLLVPGYQEVWVGVLLADRTVLPITRRLWSENGPACASLNLVELAEICKAREIIKEAFKLDVILVADSGFRRKELLHWLKKVEGMDFVIRIEGRLTIRTGDSKGLLEQMGPWWPTRVRMQWRDNSKHVMLSDVSARQVAVMTECKDHVSFNVACLVPANSELDPMYLATTLTTKTTQDLMMIVRLYSWRWAIETFFWKFKQGLRADSWQVFSSWHAIDSLLVAAHLAYLVLVLLAELIKQGKTRGMRLIFHQLEQILRLRFAKPPKLTLGRFFQLIACDFPSPYPAGAIL